MSLRKLAGLLAALGLVAGMLGSGLGAQFLDSVTGTENIQVGSFGCEISSTSDGAYLGAYVDGHAHSVTYNAPPILSSAPGSAPFAFTVTNYGSIPDVLTLTPPAASAPWAVIGSYGARRLGRRGQLHVQRRRLVGRAEQHEPRPERRIHVDRQLHRRSRSSSATRRPWCRRASRASGSRRTPSPNSAAGATFAGSARNLATSTVTMVAGHVRRAPGQMGGCASTPGATYPAPITFNVYAVGSGNAVGALLASKNQTFQIPFRPAWDPIHCPTTDQYHPWWDGTACKNGLASDITFTFPSGTTLGNTAIFGIAYNTDNHGYSPINGSGSPLDSLNIGMYPGTGPAATTPIVGTFLPTACLPT